VTRVVELWRASKADAIVWMIVFCTVILGGLMYGLIVGIISCCMSAIVRTRYTIGVSLTPVAGVWVDTSNYDQKKSPKLPTGIIVFRFLGPILFANKNRFTEQLVKCLKFDPGTVNKNRNKIERLRKESTQIETNIRRNSRIVLPNGERVKGSVFAEIGVFEQADVISARNSQIMRAQSMAGIKEEVDFGENTNYSFIDEEEVNSDFGETSLDRKVGLTKNYGRKHSRGSIYNTGSIAPSIASSAVAVDLENQLQKKVEGCSRLIKLHNRIHELEEATKLPPVQGTEIKLKYLILDFSCVSYIDTDGMSLIAKLAMDLKKLDIRLLITQANVTVSKNLSVGQKLLAERCPVEVWPKIFITIDAAVNHLLETSSIYRSSLGKNAFLPGGCGISQINTRL